ncbi:MAG: AAA family ATPase [Kiritimatiellaeota bacterium]|nr:AAA family ATPase [Kiritimatiellota bacterium]
MIVTSIKVRGYGCFKKNWCGFDEIKPVNLIIGRNNTGKSRLLDLLEDMCAGTYHGDRTYLCHGRLDEEPLRRIFPEDTFDDEGGPPLWIKYGKPLVDALIEWERTGRDTVRSLRYLEQEPKRPINRAAMFDDRLLRVSDIAASAYHFLRGKNLCRLFADRDIRPEPASSDVQLRADGTGATNLVRSYINDSKRDRGLIQAELFSALGHIFGTDGKFTEIVIRQVGNGESADPWEIFLGEEKKDLVPLSSSGSGLKTIILVLLNLLVVPASVGKKGEEFVFSFEELENNLHPALLRRLLQYLEDYACRQKSVLFLTTHSSVAVDLLGASPNVQLIHVSHDGESANARTITTHFDKLGIISDLGAKPSDLLQANGIIWVEGPSDRVYLNRWIEIFSEGKFREGRDYQCVFYGGALLARTQFSTPESAVDELANLFQVNPNFVVVCDGDRTTARGAGSELKARVLRVKSEVEKIPGSHIWITDGKEIENYIPGAILSSVYSVASLPDPEQYQHFLPTESAGTGHSYAEINLAGKRIDKVDLALQATPHMDKAKIETRFDLAAQMAQIIGCIRRWNT